jgi:hypothetical protein
MTGGFRLKEREQAHHRVAAPEKGVTAGPQGSHFHDGLEFERVQRRGKNVAVGAPRAALDRWRWHWPA